MKLQLSKDERRALLEYLFDCPESLIQSETEDEFSLRLHSLGELWKSMIDQREDNFNDASNFFSWFNQYLLETFHHHLIASVRIQAGYLDRHDSPRLFYNNDIEAMNHVLKNDTQWQMQPLSRIIDIIESQMTTPKN